MRQLEQEIKNLDSIVAAEAAEGAEKNSLGTWLLSLIYKKTEDSEEKKACKDRERQERRIEKDMKERRLALKKGDLKKEENLLIKAKEEVDAADLVDNRKIKAIQDRILARENRERQERVRVEKERLAKIWEQQREAAEALRKQQAEERAAERKRQEEWARRQESINDEAKKRREQYAYHNHPEAFFTAEGSTRQASTSTCHHDGWWPKVQGRTACPECCEIWTYLLQCPGCNMKACPRCQAAIRPRIPRNAARTNRRAPPRARVPRARAPSPDFSYDYYD